MKNLLRGRSLSAVRLQIERRLGSLGSELGTKAQIIIQSVHPPNVFRPIIRLSCLLLIAMAFTGTAVRAQFMYTEFNGKIMITGYTGEESEVVIPDMIDGKPVTGVQSSARFGKRVTSVSIPASVTYLGGGQEPAFIFAINLTNISVAAENLSFVSIDGVVFSRDQTSLHEFPPGRGGNYVAPEKATSIGLGAFKHCARLESIDLANVQRIESEAFVNCRRLSQVTFHEGFVLIASSGFTGCASLTNIALPKTFSSLREYAFLLCTNLAEISVDPGNSYFSSSEGILFDKAQSRILMCPPKAKSGAYKIPAGVSEIEDRAFTDCNEITSLDLSGVFTIGSAAFWRCSKLESVVISTNLATLEDAAFHSCSSLRSITIPPKINSIKYGTFWECGSLTNAAMHTNIQSIESSAFYRCTSLESVILPTNLQLIDTSAFRDCAGLKTMFLPRNLRDIGSYAFSGCARLSAFSLDALNANFVVIDGVLFDKEQRTLVKYPEAKAGSYTIPEGVQTIKIDSFAWSPGLTSLTVPKTVATIDSGAFAGCSSLAAINVDPLNTNYTSMDGVLFDKSKLTILAFPPGRGGDYEIPESTQILPFNSFNTCALLTSLKIPASLRSFQATFNGCTNLKAIYVDPANFYYTNIDGVVFDKSLGLGVQWLHRYPPGKGEAWKAPEGTQVIGNSAFFGSSGLKHITFPKSLMRIEDFAFYECTNLLAAVFEGDEPVGAILNVTAAYAPRTVYYAEGAKGWDFTYGSPYPVPWKPAAAIDDPTFGFREERFGFALTGVTNVLAVVEASATLVNPVWTAISTNEAMAGTRIVDSETPGEMRFYRFRSF